MIIFLSMFLFLPAAAAVAPAFPGRAATAAAKAAEVGVVPEDSLISVSRLILKAMKIICATVTLSTESWSITISAVVQVTAVTVMVHASMILSPIAGVLVMAAAQAATEVAISPQVGAAVVVAPAAVVPAVVAPAVVVPAVVAPAVVAPAVVAPAVVAPAVVAPAVVAPAVVALDVVACLLTRWPE